MKPRPRGLRARPLLIIAAALVAVLTATLPSLVSAVPAPPKPHEAGHPGSAKQNSSRVTNAGLPFRPGNYTIDVTARRGHVYGLTVLDAGARLRLPNGKLTPPETYHLKIEYLTADDMVMSSEVNGRKLTIDNMSNGDPSKFARLGHKGSDTQAWASINSLKVCITAQTLYTLTSSWSGSFQGRLAEVWALIASVFKPYEKSPLWKVGPCLQLKELAPILAVIATAGVPLPYDLPGEHLDLRIYTGFVKTPDPAASTLFAPVARAKVERL